jgi:Flp pilus assembly pilin Flp
MLKLLKNKKGQGLVEYALLIAGVAMICAAAVSIFGHKTSDMIAAVATIIPGAHADDNGSIQSGKLIETTAAAVGGGGAGTGAALDVTTIAANGATARLGVNVGLGASAADFGGLVNEAQ